MTSKALTGSPRVFLQDAVPNPASHPPLAWMGCSCASSIWSKWHLGNGIEVGKFWGFGGDQGGLFGELDLGVQFRN